jgi:hypothetical protein
MAQDSISQRKYISLIDIYYYAISVMAEENMYGTTRESKIEGVGKSMERAIGERYDRLATQLEEVRRASIIRTIPELEAPPMERVPERRTPSEFTEAEWTNILYSRVTFREELMEGLAPDDPEAVRMREEIRDIESEMLARIETLPPEEKEKVEWIRRRILAHQRAETVAEVPRVEEELMAPEEVVPTVTEEEIEVVPVPPEEVEEAPAAPAGEVAVAEEAPPAEVPSAPVEAPVIEHKYTYDEVMEKVSRVMYLLNASERFSGSDLNIPEILYIEQEAPDTGNRMGEEIRGIYEDLRGSVDSLLKGEELTEQQRTRLSNLQFAIETVLGA